MKNSIVKLQNLRIFNKFDCDFFPKLLKKHKNTQKFYCGRECRGAEGEEARDARGFNDFSIIFLLSTSYFPQMPGPLSPVKLYEIRGLGV